MPHARPTTPFCTLLEILIDAQLPPALARWITLQGHQAIHVLEIGLAGSDDSSIWDEAKRTNSVIISKDEDFVDRWLLRDEGVQLAWVRKGNCSNRALMSWFEPLWPALLLRLQQRDRLIELRP